MSEFVVIVTSHILLRLLVRLVLVFSIVIHSSTFGSSSTISSSIFSTSSSGVVVKPVSRSFPLHIKCLIIAFLPWSGKPCFMGTMISWVYQRYKLRGSSILQFLRPHDQFLVLDSSSPSPPWFSLRCCLHMLKFDWQRIWLLTEKSGLIHLFSCAISQNLDVDLVAWWR